MLIEWLDGHSLQRGILKEERKTKLKVETLTGRIVSLPAKRFHLKHQAGGDVSDFFPDIDRESQKVDCELLHSAVEPGRSYSLEELAGEWFSLDQPKTREMSVILSACLDCEPWFRVDNSGQVKASGEEDIRRWEKEREEKARLLEEREHIEDVFCRALQLPMGEGFPDQELLSKVKKPFLDYLTAKTSLEGWPALQSAVERISAREHLSHASLFCRVLEAGGILPSAYHIHMAKFHQSFFLKSHEEDREFLPGQSWYPDILEEEGKSLLETLRKSVETLPPALPKYIFSVDHSTTEEVDDALSAEEMDEQTFRVGIHIAAPGAFLSEEGAVHRTALERSTTVYQPDCKWTMLPREIIADFSLKEGQPRPVISAYFLVDRSTLTIKSLEFRMEKLAPSVNLDYDFLEESLTEEFIPGLSKVRKDPDFFQKLAAEDRRLWPNDVPQSLDPPLGEAVRILVPFCRELFILRHRNQAPFVRGREYVIQVKPGGLVEVELRRRNSPAENIVTELMILMNSQTAEFLVTSGCPAVYRTQRPDMPDLKRGRSKADLTINPREHGGIGASLYCWATSPIRRYADLINQRQLASLLGGPLPCFRDESELLIRAKKAEFLNQASLNHQRRMERFWILKYLEQHREEAQAVNLHPKDRSVLVVFQDIPLHINISREEAVQTEGPALFYPESFDFYSLEVRGRFMPK
jgi:hypothetical protein